MIYVATGISGFIIARLCYVVSLRRIPKAKPVTWILGCGLLVYPLVMISLVPSRLLLPVWSTWLEWVVLTSTGLSIYFLLINLPLRETYIFTGAGDGLMTAGFLILARHPWILMFVLALISLLLVSRSSLPLAAAPVLISVNVLLVVIQDKFFFYPVFEEYDRYRPQTPVLTPNRWSINTLVNSLKPCIA